MSEFILSSLKNIVSQIDKLDDTVEVRSIKTIAEVLIDRVSHDGNNATFVLLNTIEEDLKKVKNKTSVFRDYRFWVSILGVCIPLQAIIWNLFMLKVTNDLTEKFTEKKFEKIINSNSKTLESHILLYTTSTQIQNDINSSIKTSIERNKSECNANNDVLKEKIWINNKEKGSIR